MLRPVPARWFEVLVAQDDVAAALEALADTGTIELEVHAAQKPLAPAAELKPVLDSYAELVERYQTYWPPAGAAPHTGLPAREVLAGGLERIHAWREVADPVIHTLQDLEQELAELEIWHELFTRFKASVIDFGLLRKPDGVLARRLYVFPPDTVFPLPPDVMAQRFALRQQACVLVVGPAESVAVLDRQATALKGRRSGLGMPGWLEGQAADNLLRVARRTAQVQASLVRLRTMLQEINRKYELARVLGEIERLRWFVQQVRLLPATDYFAWLTGWTSDLKGRRLETALARARLRALLRFPPPPENAVAPLILQNPPWVRPFELFARAIGVPSREEVDPSLLLAVVVPLMFGYMFGDVGHGLVLLAVGLWLRRRLTVARLLIVGSVASIVFGFLFGSVFTREDLIPALWLHPLAEPFTVLALPLGFGAALLALGLALAAVEAHWRGRFRRWVATDAGMLLFYLGALAGIAQPPLLWLGIAGIAWYVAGYARYEPGALGVFAGLGSALEHAFQLAVNTLSFVRIGAFALAHAGLGAATVALADAAGPPLVAALVLVLGNILILALEGLVVSIQTTRLVLFEFFIRFLRGEGRAFRPLPAPHAHV